MRNQSGPSFCSQGWAAMALVLAIGGCSTIENTMGPLTSVFSSPAPAPAVTPNTPTNISAEENCPGATVRQGAAAWSLSGGPGANNVRYQASIAQIARECAVLGDTMTIKVGVEGRLLVGPRGGPGTVTVPLRIALVQEGPQPRPILSKFYPVTVSVAPGTTQTSFSQVEDDITFPIPADRNLERYVIYVGFDPQSAVPAARQQKKKRAAPKRQAAPKVQQQKAPPQSAPPPAQNQPTFQPPSNQPPRTPTFDPPPRVN